MTNQKSNDPLHGKTLEMILLHLVDYYGWEELSYRIKIKCFSDNPSIKSSLNFLRKTAWARKKVESLYLYSLRKEQWASEKRTTKNNESNEVDSITVENRDNNFKTNNIISNKSKKIDDEEIDSESLDLDNQYEADILKQLKKSFG